MRATPMAMLLRKHPDTASVSIRVRDLAQMFNSFDPSPFWDRDLDQNAAAFSSLPTAVDQGLIVLAWVALWRPIETLAYGWVPLYRRRRLYERLRRVHVTVRVGSGGGGAASSATVTQTPAAATQTPFAATQTPSAAPRVAPAAAPAASHPR